LTVATSPIVQAVGAVLPMAMAIALSPFPVIGIVLILAAPRGRRNGPLFALGWMTGLTVVVTIVVVLLEGSSDPDSTSSVVVDWLRVLAGGGLVVLGARKVVTRPRDGEEVAAPAWMASLDEAGPGRAVALGLLLSGANPKNVVLAAAAASAAVDAGAEGVELAVAVAVFVVLSSWTVLGAVLAHLVGGARAVRLLESVRLFMVANSTVITAVVLLLIGFVLFGEGISGLAG
jgi:threonine/homoserine/homoserine lactone efflux protein